MRLGDMLLKAGVVNELQLNAAIQEQKNWGGRLGQVLVRMGALSEELLVMALSRQLQLPRADLSSLEALPEALRGRIDQATCERYRVLPIGYLQDKKTVQLAMSDPFDVVALDDLSRRFGTRIDAFLAGDEAISAAIRRVFSAGSSYLASQGNSLDFIDNGGRPMTGTGVFRAPGQGSGPMRAAPGPPPQHQQTMPPAPLPPPTPQTSSWAIPQYAPMPPQPMPPQPMQHMAPGPITTTMAMPPTTFPARVDEQFRFVRALAELLIERRVIRPDDLRRR